MKTKEEIEQLANDHWEGCDGCDANDKYFFIKGFGCAYRQMQQDMADKKYTEQDMIKFAFDTYYQEDMAKKYTEEDIRNAFFSGGVMKDIDEFNHFINSLNKQD